MPKKKVIYADRPEMTEQFADSVYRLDFTGHVLRIEFIVHRPEGEDVNVTPAARVALSAQGMVDLHARLGRMIEKLERQGVMKRHAEPELRIVSAPGSA